MGRAQVRRIPPDSGRRLPKARRQCCRYGRRRDSPLPSKGPSPPDLPLPLPRSHAIQEVHAPWEFASHLETGGPDPRTTVRELLAGQGNSVVTTLQQRGVTKLGEFLVESDLVYPAFDGEPILTLGSKERDVDFEALWTRHLQDSLPKRERPTGVLVWLRGRGQGRRGQEAGFRGPMPGHCSSQHAVR